MKANSDKSKQSNKATRRVLAGVLCGASVLSLVLSLVMPPISQAIANDAQAGAAEETVADESTLGEDAGADNSTGKDAENQNSDDAEGGEGEDAAAADPAADDTGAEGDAQPADAQPSDDETNDESANTPAIVSADGYTEVDGNVADTFAHGGKFQLKGSAFSDTQIAITKDTTIDLAGRMLYNHHGGLDSFFLVNNGATLTIEDTGNEDTGKTIDKQTEVKKSAGQLATMEWGKGSGSNKGTPKSLTYYETRSTPNPDGLGTTETTYEHVVTGFGAIDAASESGSVKHVVNVKSGGTLDLKGGMITTAANLSNDGHVVFSKGTVKIEGGYVTNGNNGGWGGGLCIAGKDTNAKLEMTGGVVAGNKAASGGGIYADDGATLNLAGGVISGNATYGNPYNDVDHPNNGYGGGVFTKRNTNVTISGSAIITNNRVDSYITDKFNLGLLGGGGIASVEGGTLNMTGGSVTANYSKEAGGGIYAGFWGKAITFTMTGGTIAGNESVNGEGGGLRIAGANGTGTIARINAGDTGKIYITNNKTMTGSTKDRGGDWGGGGIFIQEHGRLNVLRSLITGNKAGGWSGGIGACPTGETIVSHSYGAAIYGNKDNVDQNGNPLGTYHYSAGGNNKNQDHDEKNYVTPDFQDSGHKDFFLVRNKDSATSTIAVVLGKMLGGGSAGWHGTCDGNPVTIDPNGGAEAKWMFGLEANPAKDAKEKAQGAATTIISGNYSYTHGGGIMTNGDLVVGEVNDLRVYPSMKLNATKVLVDAKGNKQNLNGHAYKFQLLRQDGTGAKAPSWKDDGTFDMGECSVAGEATVDPTTGNITFDSGKDYSSGQYVFYLVEEPISGENELDTKFDKTIYKIEVTVEDDSSHSETLMGFKINYYKVQTVVVYKKAEDNKDFVQLSPGDYSVGYSEDNTTATVAIGKNGKPTFTNKIEPYKSLGSWTPAATKVVKGGEMKEFTLEFADNTGFKEAETVKTDPNGVITTTADGDKSQTLGFVEIKYNLASLKQSDSDVPGRGAYKTFTYYVREKGDSSIFSHYKFDQSVYRFKVVATDNTKGRIDCAVTYMKGTVDSDGNWKADVGAEEQNLTESTPTFTNTYSTTLPLSGMSGVTLTYLAGGGALRCCSLDAHSSQGECEGRRAS